MKLVTPEQMKTIDAVTISDYGIPGLVLMENAASAVSAKAAAMLEGCRGRNVVLLAGRGNNGGDAFAAARKLYGMGAGVKTYLVGMRTGVSGDALSNLTILDRIGLPVTELTEERQLDELDENLQRAQLIIDGIFGTGLAREVTGLAKNVIERANSSGRPILSIDIPSGVDGRDGSVKGVCIHAAATVTFCLPKLGLILHPGCEHTGELVTADIGTPPCVLDACVPAAELIDDGLAAQMIPQRSDDSNKGSYGKAFLITGSTGMTGSGRLASMAALRAGAGLVYAGVPGSLAPVYGAALTEPILLPLEDGGTGRLSEICCAQVLEHMKKMNVIAIGPGLTTSHGIRELVEKVIRESRVPVILDADALNVVSQDTSILKGLSVPAAVTPHPGEMARLTGLTIQEVQRDRIGIARKFAKEYKVIVVLKGSRTVIALPDGRITVNPTGNAGMATAGAGDVLTGMIAGLAAQRCKLEDAVTTGVYLHGLAGDMAAQKLGLHGMVASDMIDMLPYAIKKLTESRR